MRRFSTLAILLVAAFVGVKAQNVQLHYDLGHNLYNDLSSRTTVTSTVEMFKPDTWGSTFMFTDIDYKSDGAIGAYWEISREFNLTKNKRWAAHVEYNGGLALVRHRTTITGIVISMQFSLVEHGTGLQKTFQKRLVFS